MAGAHRRPGLELGPYMALEYDLEKTIHALYGKRSYLQASQKGFRDMIQLDDEHCPPVRIDTQVEFSKLLEIAKRALSNAELDIAEKSSTQAIKTQQLRSIERSVKPYLYLAEVHEEKAKNQVMEVLQRQRFLLQAAALYNFVLNFLEGGVSTEEESVRIRKIVMVKLDNIQDSLISMTGGNLLNCTFHSERNRQKLKLMRLKIKERLSSIDSLKLTDGNAPKSELDFREIFVQQIVPVKDLCEVISNEIKGILTSIIEECIKVLGEPPCDYEVVVLGSLARNEMTPYSDLEWAILVSSEEEDCKVYFRNLTNLVHLQIINLGETILPSMDIKALKTDWFFDDITPRGLSFDAFLPQACKTPLGNFEDFELIHCPEKMVEFQSSTWYEKNPGLAEILLTVSSLESDKHDLVDQYKTELAAILRLPCELHRHVGKTFSTRGACRGFKSLQTDLSRYESAVVAGENELDEGKLYDVKKEIYRLTDRVISGLGKCFEVQGNGAFEVLDELRRKDVISPSARDNLASASAIGLKLRISTYLKAGKQGEELRARSEDATPDVISRYHMPQNEELFHFFYVTIPLYEKVRHLFLADKEVAMFSCAPFFDSRNFVKAIVYCRILNYTKAVECYERALQADCQNVNIEIRQLRLLLIINNNTDFLREKLDCLLDKISEGVHIADSPSSVQLDDILTAVHETELRQLMEILMLISSLESNPCYSNLAEKIFDHSVAIQNKSSESQLLLMDFAFSNSHLTKMLNRKGFDSSIASLSALIDNEGVSSKTVSRLNKLSEIFSIQGKLEISYQCSQRALTMERLLYGTNASLNIMKTLLQLGKVSMQLFMFMEGNVYLELVLRQFEKFGGPRLRVLHKDAYLQLAIVSAGLARNEEAISYLERGLALSTDKKLALELNFDCIMYCELAKSWYALGNKTKAVESALNAKKCLQSIAVTESKVAITCHMAMTFHQLRVGDEGVTLLQEEIKHLNACPERKAECLIFLGRICSQKCQDVDAEDYYTDALKAFTLCQNAIPLDQLLECLFEVSDILAGNGKPLEARKKLEEAEKYIPSLTGRNEKCAMFNELGERWERFGAINLAYNFYEKALALCKDATLVTNIPLTRFKLEIKLGDLAVKASVGQKAREYESYVSEEQRLVAQRLHYDRAGSLLMHYAERGSFDTLVVELFLLLAMKYQTFDAEEMEKLLLKGLEKSDVLYGSEKGNEMTSTILYFLFYCNLLKGEVTSAASCIERALRLEIDIHSSDSFHPHICHRLFYFSWLQLMMSSFGEDTTDLLVDFFQSGLNMDDFPSSPVTAKADAAHCFTLLSLLLWRYNHEKQAQRFNCIAQEIFEEIGKHEKIPADRSFSRIICDNMKKILDNPSSRQSAVVDLMRHMSLQSFNENNAWGISDEHNQRNRLKSVFESVLPSYFHAKNVNLSSFLPRFIALYDQYQKHCNEDLSPTMELLRQFSRQIYGDNPVLPSEPLDLGSLLELLPDAKNVCFSFLSGGIGRFVGEAGERVASTNHGAVTDYSLENLFSSAFNVASSLFTNATNDGKPSVLNSLLSGAFRFDQTYSSLATPTTDVDSIQEKNGGHSKPVLKDENSGVDNVTEVQESSDIGAPVACALDIVKNLFAGNFLAPTNSSCTNKNRDNNVLLTTETQGNKKIESPQNPIHSKISEDREVAQIEKGIDIIFQESQSLKSTDFETMHSVPQLKQFLTPDMLAKISEHLEGKVDALQMIMPAIRKLSDAAASGLKEGELGRYTEAKDNLLPLIKSFLEILPSSKGFEKYLKSAEEDLKSKKVSSARSALSLAAQFQRSKRQDARLLKTSAECYMEECKYRLAAINFTCAASYYSSQEAREPGDALKYLETLVSLIKAHLLCQKFQDAWQVCQDGFEVAAQIEPNETPSVTSLELLYLSAKCSFRLSKLRNDDEMAKALSFARQALAASEMLDDETKSNHVLENLGRNRELFAIECETQLLLATILLQLNKRTEMEQILTDMKNFLANLAVSFEVFDEDSWKGGKIEFYKVSRRLFAWIGRALVINGEFESAITWLTKSLTAFATTAACLDILSLCEEFIPLMDAITVAKEHLLCVYNNPFQLTVDACKRKFLETHGELDTLCALFCALGYLFMEAQRTREAIDVCESALAAAGCLSDSLEDQRLRAQVELYLGHAHRLHFRNIAGAREKEERAVARNYYESGEGTDLHRTTLCKKLSLASWLVEENEITKASALVHELLDLGEALENVPVNLGYSSRHFYGPVIRNYIEEHGETTTNLMCLVQSLAVSVYVETGLSTEAVSVCRKLSNLRDFKVLLSTQPSLTSYLLAACHKKLASLVNEPDLLNSDFPLEPENLAKLYYKLKEYSLALECCSEILDSLESSSSAQESSNETNLISLKLNCLRVAGNSCIQIGDHGKAYSFFLSFLELLQVKEQFFEQEFDNQCAILARHSFADPFYIFRSLGIMYSRRGNTDGTIKYYEKCLEEDEKLVSHQDLVATLAELYQSKALLHKNDSASYKRWMSSAHDSYSRLFRKTMEVTPFVELCYGSFLCRCNLHREAVDHFLNVITRNAESEIYFGDVDKPLVDAHLAREIQVQGSIRLPLKIFTYHELSLTYKALCEVEKSQESAYDLENCAYLYESSSNYPLILSVVGYTYEIIGDRKKAISIFASVLEKIPGHAPVVEALESFFLDLD